jgi:hypothetical protein
MAKIGFSQPGMKWENKGRQIVFDKTPSKVLKSD